MFNLLFLLPQIFTVGQDLIDCLDGDVDQKTWDKTVDDVYNLALSVPEIKGFLAMNQSLFMLAKMVFPFVKQLDDLFHKAKVDGTPETDPLKLEAMKFAAATKEMSKEDLTRAFNTVKLLSQVSDKIAADEKVSKIEFDKDSIVKYYENKFDTETFFDNQNNG